MKTTIMDLESKIHKEIDLVQEIIKRQSQNSFQIKSWLIAILTAIIVIGKDSILMNQSTKINAIALNVFLFLPIFCFWYLDAFFLSKERLYREVYKWIIRYRRTNPELYLYDLNTFEREIGEVKEKLDLEKNKTNSLIFNPNIMTFYMIPTIFVIGILIWNLFLL